MTGQKKILIVFALAVFEFAGSLSVLASPPSPPPKLNPGLATIQTPDGFTIYAEIANTPDQRSQGLMYRTRLAPDRGMLFTFPEPGIWTFWMKNTKMALDMLWLDEKGVIVHIQHAAPICERKDNLCPRYRSNKPAVAVLELGPGRSKTLNLAPGKKLTIELP
ncbi:DUF192 domain-containing protein [Candidatus Nitronereus thalassa]|uniref:DUF192 domain-containing protein n=1 Tax=Candidatus Nitronereus thalassa TaxID=3020898 RepID=A0ABU3KCH0_9BACT|nr:DUF192 domain-containing protein [Candidatus Nitronereus thalassa]MDT7043872.1 DUF192 domain-containing protein [Candidatus Nitronereus thalassa]